MHVNHSERIGAKKSFGSEVVVGVLAKKPADASVAGERSCRDVTVALAGWAAFSQSGGRRR